MLEISIVIPVIIGLSEIAKKLNFDIKYIPILNLVFGIIAGIIYIEPTDIKMAVFQGIVAGLTASGLYSSTKNVKQGFTEGQ